MNCSRKDTFFLQFTCHHFAAARFLPRCAQHPRRDHFPPHHPSRGLHPRLPSPADLRPALHHSATSWRNPQRYPHNFAVGAPSLTNKPHKNRAPPHGRALNRSLFTDYYPPHNRGGNGRETWLYCWQLLAILQFALIEQIIPHIFLILVFSAKAA